MVRKLIFVLTNNQAPFLPSLNIDGYVAHWFEGLESDLAKARRAGREAVDLHRLIVVGVVLVIRHVVVALRSSCGGRM